MLNNDFLSAAFKQIIGAEPERLHPLDESYALTEKSTILVKTSTLIVNPIIIFITG